jgi:hypothetical protein
LFNHHTRPVLLSLALFVLLAVAHTWPMAAAPSHWSRIDGDGGLNTWAVAWVAHSLIESPTRIFEANIFYPQHLTLAYSEALLLQGLFAVPVIAFGGSAVLAYNVSVFSGFVLTGWMFCLLIRRWTGSWSAGCVGGSLAAFNAYTLVNLTHMQFLHTGFFALMLFALDRLIVSARARDAGWLAIAFVLQALASIYLMVFAVFALAFALLARIGDWIRRSGPLMLRLGGAAVIALVLLWPYLSPYRDLNVAQHFVRTADEAEAASWRNYLSTGARVHYDNWSREVGGDVSTSVFPGIAALTLVALAFVDRDQRRDPRFRMCAIAAGGCIALSFAPLLPFYPSLHAAVPLLQMVRAIHRIGQVMLLFIAILAGYGVAAMDRVWGGTRTWALSVAAMLVLVNGEALRAPVGYIWFDGVPAVYDVLAKEPNAVVAEAPFPMPSQWFLNSPYMVNSTRHWKPMLNGYSGFRPASYDTAYTAMRDFPSDASLIALNKLGVTHVVVHRREMMGDLSAGDPFNHVASIRLLAKDDDVLIYKLLGQ